MNSAWYSALKGAPPGNDRSPGGIAVRDVAAVPSGRTRHVVASAETGFGSASLTGVVTPGHFLRRPSRNL